MNTASNLLIALGLTLSSTSIFMLTNPVSAQQGGNISNDEYIIHETDLNLGSESEPQSTTRDDDEKTTSPGVIEGDNYKIRSGSKYYSNKIPFEFSVSNRFVDYGPFVPGNPVTRTTRLVLSSGSSFKYNVLGFENHPLKSDSEDEIPDTTCDSGTCSEITASTWMQNTTYGFGYSCTNITGNSCFGDFDEGNKFKQFSNLKADEKPQIIMGQNNPDSDLEVEIEYKLNISSSQPETNYSNIITYIAVPSI